MTKVAFLNGVICKENQMISIAQKDPEILEDIKIEMESTHPLTQNKHTGVYMLNLGSKIIKHDLMNLHEITPNKSYDIKFPYIPEQYLHHFVRGYFDGDGYVNYPSYIVSFVGGSYDFMNSFNKLLHVKQFDPRFSSQKNCHRIILSGRKTAKRFSEWIYQDKGLFLKRKYEIFQQETLSVDQLQDRKLKMTTAAANQRKEDFLIKYKQCNCIEASCHSVGVGVTTFYNWIRKDIEFKVQYEQLCTDKK
ncbi:LAGLIDADG family homing endonuclease [Bacillus manliponensis]|uniref:LAGLIDADG family homing endonuclease n=1 Tax=Bacillus manliponensis TaxID=574376 RepID=UPI0035189665